MNAYDPQARRARSRPAAVSPIDTLLGDPEAIDESDSVASPVGGGVAGDEVAEAPEAAAGRPDGEVRPFEAPPIELACGSVGGCADDPNDASVGGDPEQPTGGGIVPESVRRCPPPDLVGAGFTPVDVRAPAAEGPGEGGGAARRGARGKYTRMPMKYI